MYGSRFGTALGLDGVILLAYVIAIPANEIVVPTILMAYAGTGTLIRIDSLPQLRSLLVDQHGWTLLTAVSFNAVLRAPQPVLDHDLDDLQGSRGGQIARFLR